MAKTIVGLFDTSRQAHAAVQDLIDSGFNRDTISLVASEEEEEGKGEGKARAKGAAKGAGTGAAIGGAAGLLLGLTGLAIPGLGPILAAGPIASLLAGAGIGAAAGGILGALTKMGVPEEEAHHYAEGVRRGGTLVTLTADDAAAERAVEIMNRHGAVDIDRRAAQWRQAGWNRFDEKAAPFTAQQKTKEREAVLPVVEEEVKVGKREVERGGVRVYSHVVETPVEEKVTLREEHATIERRPVDRPVTAAERDLFKEQTIEIRETAEEPVVSKTARVKEEVVVGTEAAEHTETVRETVRRTEVEVQQQLDAEDEEFRRHHRTYFAGAGSDYGSYQEAYRHAGILVADPRYEGKDWSAIESDVRVDWEKTHPGTWSKFKDAIHYGWDRVSRRPAYAGKR